MLHVVSVGDAWYKGHVGIGELFGHVYLFLLLLLMWADQWRHHRLLLLLLLLLR